MTLARTFVAAAVASFVTVSGFSAFGQAAKKPAPAPAPAKKQPATAPAKPADAKKPEAAKPEPAKPEPAKPEAPAEPDKGDASKKPEEPPGGAGGKGETGDKPAGVAAAVAASAEAGADSSPVEVAGRTYQFVGARFRYIILPKFMMGLFGKGGASVGIWGVGPEFSIRKDNFEYVLSLWYANHTLSPTPFKASNDPDVAWEIVDAKLHVLYATADFLWSSELGETLRIVYGGGAGLGAVFGDIHRVQAYPPAGVTDPYKYERCRGVGDPDPAYCKNDNDHYGNYTEPSWASGGSKPIVFPWMALQTGLRFKSSRTVATRLDLGWSITGPFVGLSGQYGL